MQPENQPRVPVISSDGLSLIPCRPNRDRRIGPEKSRVCPGHGKNRNNRMNKK